MICTPSRSACFSYSRLYFMSHAPSPNCEPCEMASPQPPPMMAPAMAPATAPIWNFCALVALAVPWRSSTCDSSCAITPMTSPSPWAASNMPRFTNIGPPGSAKALISFRFTGVNEYSKAGLLSEAGAAATSARPARSR